MLGGRDQPVEELVGRVDNVHDLLDAAPSLGRALLEHTDAVLVAAVEVVDAGLDPGGLEGCEEHSVVGTARLGDGVDLPQDIGVGRGRNGGAVTDGHQWRRGHERNESERKNVGKQHYRESVKSLQETGEQRERAARLIYPARARPNTPNQDERWFFQLYAEAIYAERRLRRVSRTRASCGRYVHRQFLSRARS